MAAPKLRIVLASHGEQSKGMLNTVQMLLGEQENIAAYSLYPEQPVTDLTEKLQAEIDQYGAENIIFMTELKQGSPFNAVVSLTRNHDLYHITGINLAALMTAIMERDDENITAAQLCETVMEESQNTMLDVRKLLAAGNNDEDEEEL
ncbi:MAG: PTS sugar transporter subunit IIA [Oscillibacter sp.]|nr:PTS sugar transporter subunit IIA [Oscillibacter sp.]